MRERPAEADWTTVPEADIVNFNRDVLGEKLIRLDSATIARLRVIPREVHRNPMGTLHGGFVMALVDYAMFAGSAALKGQTGILPAVTIDLGVRFVGAGDMERPVDVLVEMVKETGRMVFLRGSVMQEDDLVASWDGILRKVAKKA
ncbi:PaaI family thioesterase [Aurantiacibacter spongiae]|uniref:PaaI family thioesterase n=1 Tax=Aurantiacibacter spongiae TaxID=2488860 RepID=UPI001315ACC1|nr:PaaI family thioesterase [Aurantiacibacter spongiae]